MSVIVTFYGYMVTKNREISSASEATERNEITNMQAELKSHESGSQSESGISLQICLKKKKKSVHLTWTVECKHLYTLNMQQKIQRSSTATRHFGVFYRFIF